MLTSSTFESAVEPGTGLARICRGRNLSPHPEGWREDMAMGLRAASPVLVARQGEMGGLLQALDAAMESGSASVLVGGEAGVGKTRLVREFAGVAERRGARVCIGRCLEFGDAIWPLAPLGEILTGLGDEMDDETLDLVIGNARGVVSRLVGGVGESSHAGTIVSSEQLCQLLVAMFGRLAERRPLVLVVEDLHWADDVGRTVDRDGGPGERPAVVRLRRSPEGAT
jgi:predicted ATPase